MSTAGIGVAALAVLVGLAGSADARPNGSPPPGIQLAHDSLSFCTTLHSGSRDFQLRLRNNRRVAIRVTVSIEGGPRYPFVVPPTTVRIVRGPWNGKHGMKGCHATITWDHTRLTATLPLGEE